MPDDLRPREAEMFQNFKGYPGKSSDTEAVRLIENLKFLDRSFFK